MRQCRGTESPHADINGDGIADQLDASFVTLNFEETDKQACCPSAVSAGGEPPLTSVTVEELDRRGLGYLRRFDVNGDGVLTLDDLRRAWEQVRTAKRSRGRSSGR